MLRELQALAKLAEDKKPSERVTKLTAGISQGARGMGPAEMVAWGSLPFNPLVRHLVSSTKGFPEGSVPKNEEELLSLVKRLADEDLGDKKVGLKVTSSPMEAGYVRNFPWKKYNFEQLRLSPNSNPSTIAHELGHAVQKHKWEELLNKGNFLARTPLGTALPSLMALSGGLSSDKDTPAWAKAAPYVGGAELASILGEETRANVRALKLLGKGGISLSPLQKIRQFAPSATYLSRAAMLLGAPLGILKGFDLYEKSKHPMTFDQVLRMSPQTISETPTPEEFKKAIQ